MTKRSILVALYLTIWVMLVIEPMIERLANKGLAKDFVDGLAVMYDLGETLRRQGCRQFLSRVMEL